jgi:hypothetical protein
MPKKPSSFPSLMSHEGKFCTDTTRSWCFLNNFPNFRIDYIKNPHDINANRSTFWDIFAEWSDEMREKSLQGAFAWACKRVIHDEMDEIITERILDLQEYCSRVDVYLHGTGDRPMSLNWFDSLRFQFSHPNFPEFLSLRHIVHHLIKSCNWSDTNSCQIPSDSRRNWSLDKDVRLDTDWVSDRLIAVWSAR